MPKTYAVTGVASGIGAKLAAILKVQGHIVVGYDVEHVSDSLDHFIPLDLRDEAAIASAVAQTPLHLDGLCNNAGVPPRAGLESTILQVNFLGTRAFTEAMVPHLNPGASIVNMASRAGHGWRDSLDQVKRLAALAQVSDLDRFISAEDIDATRCYNLSKEAVILWTVAMTEILVAQDIRINSLSPGGVATGIFDDFKRAFGDKMAKNVERAGRPGTPEEIAEIAAFVLSPASHWLKGADDDDSRLSFRSRPAGQSHDLDLCRGGIAAPDDDQVAFRHLFGARSVERSGARDEAVVGQRRANGQLLPRVAHGVAQPIDTIALNEPHGAGVVVGPNALRAIFVGRVAEFLRNSVERFAPFDGRERIASLRPGAKQWACQPIRVVQSIGVACDFSAQDARCVGVAFVTPNALHPAVYTVLDL